MALSGSLNQLLNNCKTTIEGWINTIAAKYLPLSGGTMNSGANITTTTGTITAGKVVVDTNTSIDNGQMHLRVAPDSNNVVGGDANMYLWHRSEVNAGSGGTAPTANREVKVIFRSGNGKDLGYVFNRANTNKTVEQVLCVRSFDDPSNKHWHLAICHSPTAGVYTSAPHPSKLDTNGNIVINTADNSNKIATTYWIRQALPDLVGGTITGTATYAKFPNGTLICAGFVGPVQPGAQVTYPVPFTTRPYVSIVRHWGGNGDEAAGFSGKSVESAPIQIYDTDNYTTSGSTRSYTYFRVGVYESRTLWQSTNNVYGMWIAFGKWK